ncbi:MAG: hypothetical protein P9L94_11740 [Candidatus Hinthialibacter antarcticus]|nr:hypothetical protein [Candidatus Hinthialibacter antarcticus]
MSRFAQLLLIFVFIFHFGSNKSWSASLQLEGVTVTPHMQSTMMRYRKSTDRSLGARAQIFIRNTSKEQLTLSPDTKILLRGKSPEQLLLTDEWAWHDFPSAWKDAPLTLPPDALTVWTWNGKREIWGVGSNADLRIKVSDDSDETAVQISIDDPTVWLSSVTFLGQDDCPFPDRFIFHIANQTSSSLRIDACRLWLPENNKTWRALLPGEWIKDVEAFPQDGVIPAGDRGGAIVETGRLPLTYAALEVRLRDSEDRALSVWSHLRIKREAFDISGGWISSDANGRSTLTYEPYLKTLRRMHINTGHIADTGGYTDTELYDEYPLKYFNKLENLEHYDSTDMLPRVHAVEFLGEPQYGGGRPVPPMEVWRDLNPYQPTRLPTTVTHSEERIWRFYAGLSDYPHYDAYRVCAPSPDGWSLYEWGNQHIRWGAPLETIGDMTRSLRELNRPASIAYWSQGAHSGWDHYGGRQRTSPTPDELRAQAYHGLAARITSLYWFNLSLKSLLKFPDLIEPITEIGREIRLLDNFYLEGDAYHHQLAMDDTKPDWDLSVIASPRGALLFALDLDYAPDFEEKVFTFHSPRKLDVIFPLPAYLRKPAAVLKMNANSVISIPFQVMENGVRIQGEFENFNIFIATTDSKLQEELETRRQELVAYERAFNFDPASNQNDLKALQNILMK